MEQPPAIAALALDFIQRLPAEQSETSALLSGVLTEQRKLFEPEIYKFQGQIISHASGDFVVLFRKPISAVICALSLHRMFAGLSQALPELERIQLRIGVHAEANPSDDTQAQQKCIEMAHELKERVPHGSIFLSGGATSTIEETVPVDLRPVGQHKLAAAAEPLDIFELIPPPIKPLRIKRKSHFAQLRLPLAAALVLLIIGGTGYGYMFHTGTIEWPPALWSETPLEMAQQQLDSLIGFSESSATPETPTGEPSPIEDRKAVTIATTEEPPEDAAIVQPPDASSLQSSRSVGAETDKQQPSVTEAPPQPTAIMPEDGSPGAQQQPEGQQQTEQKQKPQEGSSRIAAANPSERPVVRQVQPTKSLSPAPSDQTGMDASTKSLTSKTEPSAIIASGKQQESSGSSRTAAISISKPRARPAQHSQPPVHEPEQGASTSPTGSDQTALSVMTESLAAQAEGPVSILPQQPLEQQDTQGRSSRVAAVPTGCEFLRQAFHRGTLVPSVDTAAYKRFLECQRLKIDQKREGRARVAAKPANQRTNDGSATSGGDSGSGGNSGSGGKSNGRGSSKGK